MPRPSSIYGQPSMIGSASNSPVIGSGRGVGETDRNNVLFGMQRNSMHGYNIKSKLQAPTSSSASSNIGGSAGCEPLRAQMMKAHHLDTTQEEPVEELQSPQSELISGLELGGAPFDNRSQMIPGDHSHHYISRAEALSMITGSPAIQNRPTPQHRRAVVNPILQSPTMDTIYDNHPRMLMNGGNGEPLASQSLYDNYNCNQDQSRQRARLVDQQPRESPMLARRAKPSHPANNQFYPGAAGESGAHCSLSENPYSSERVTLGQSRTPSRTPSRHQPTGLSLYGSNKPAAIVAPSTLSDQLEASQRDRSSRFDRSTSHHQMGSIENGSPMLSRRYDGASHNHQQSPLVLRNQQPRNSAYAAAAQQSIAVNIAGAPGINLDPALAASLLRGTNIDAYESFAYDNHGSAGNNGDFNNKTFLVSTRLSKSMTQHQSYSSQSNTGGSSSSSSNNAPGNTFRRSSLARDDELSSSGGSQSIHSPRSQGSRSRINRSAYSGAAKLRGTTCNSSQEDGEGEDPLAGDDCSSMESNQSSRKLASERKGSADSGCNRSGGRRGSKGSSKQWASEQSDDAAESFDSKLDVGERIWTTSKLVTNNGNS